MKLRWGGIDECVIVYLMKAPLLTSRRSHGGDTSVYLALCLQNTPQTDVFFFYVSCSLGSGPGKAGLRLPGLPVGSDPRQLLPHHHSHPRPLWDHPVPATLHCGGECASPIACLGDLKAVCVLGIRSHLDVGVVVPLSSAIAKCTTLCDTLKSL